MAEERGEMMEQKEAIQWIEAIKYSNLTLTMPELREACDMAIEAMKKRPAYLRLIKKYQTRQKNQTAELHNLQAQNEKLKAELEALKSSMKNIKHDQNVICKINGLTCIDCQPLCESREVKRCE